MKFSRHPDAHSAMDKTSSWYKDPGVIAAVAAPVAGLAVDAAAKGIGKMLESRGKAQAFKSMLRDNPHLRGRDARDTHRYFNTLWSTNPQMARDSTTAGAFVQQQHHLSSEDRPHGGILAGAKDMAQMRSDLSRGPRSPGIGRDVSGMITNVVRAGQDAHKRDLEGLMGKIESGRREIGRRETKAREGLHREVDALQGFDPGGVLRQGVNEALGPRRMPPGSGQRGRRRIVSGTAGRTYHGGPTKKSSVSSLRSLLGI